MNLGEHSKTSVRALGKSTVARITYENIKKMAIAKLKEKEIVVENVKTLLVTSLFLQEIV